MESLSNPRGILAGDERSEVRRANAAQLKERSDNVYGYGWYI